MSNSLHSHASPTSAPDRSLRAVWMLAIGVLLARVVYLVWLCRYDLVEDEAHYWLWSRYLDWSYYTKGPGVAWAIWASAKVFGNAEWAVRLPSALAAAIGAVAAGALARDVAVDARDRACDRGVGIGTLWASPARIGVLAALAYSITPVFQVASIVMTIDSPYVACWSVACWAFWGVTNRKMKHGGSRGAAEGSRSWLWLVIGAAIAVGFLFKYTMLLLLPGLVAFVIVQRRRDGARRSAEGDNKAWSGIAFGLGALLALLGLAPVLIWNAQNGWPTWHHLLGHLGVSGGDMPVSAAIEGGGGSKWSAWWLPELVAEQLGMVGPWLVLAALLAWPVNRGRRSSASISVQTEDPRSSGRLFLICAAAPILIFYALVALITEPEGNWPMAAYATLVPLVAWMGADAVALRAGARARGDRASPTVRRQAKLWRIGLWYAVFAIVPLHKADWIGDMALALGRQKWFHDAFVSVVHREPRDPVGRVRGMKEMAGHVHELLTHVYDETGTRPFVIAQHYGRASQIAYYLRDMPVSRMRLHPGEIALTPMGYVPEVVCAMAQTGGRRSQFDLWPHTRLDIDQPTLRGRPAVILTSIQPYMVDQWRGMFERVEPIPGERLRGETKTDRSALLGYGWKGPPGTSGQPPPASH